VAGAFIARGTARRRRGSTAGGSSSAPGRGAPPAHCTGTQTFVSTPWTPIAIGADMSAAV
jgi:hypothetical protein